MVERPRRRPHDKAGRKFDAKERREVGAWTFFRFPLACAPGGNAPPWQDESVIERITAGQREKLESEITGLQTEEIEKGKRRR